MKLENLIHRNFQTGVPRGTTHVQGHVCGQTFHNVLFCLKNVVEVWFGWITLLGLPERRMFATCKVSSMEHVCMLEVHVWTGVFVMYRRRYLSGVPVGGGIAVEVRALTGTASMCPDVDSGRDGLLQSTPFAPLTAWRFASLPPQ